MPPLNGDAMCLLRQVWEEPFSQFQAGISLRRVARLLFSDIRGHVGLAGPGEGSTGALRPHRVHLHTVVSLLIRQLPPAIPLYIFPRQRPSLQRMALATQRTFMSGG